VGDWLLQRLTAVAMAAYTIALVIALAVNRPHDYAAWRATFSETWFRAATMIFVAALLYHAWVGMRDILMDYVKPTAVRLSLEVGVLLMLALYLGWTVQVLWR
jgi:succinate dehydrogenase / fumarate reductase membrane anchor subunit